jgi:hypothetical protein
MAKDRAALLQRRADEATGEDKLILQLAAKVEKANRADSSVSPDVLALRDFLSGNPGIWEVFSKVSQNAKYNLMRRATGDKQGYVELLSQEYAQRRDELGWQEASNLERLVIERIMLCWLWLLFAESYNAHCGQAGVSLAQGEHADKLLNRAHTRYVKACESLARLRKVEAITRAANAAAEIVEMRAKTTRARINAAHPGVLTGQSGPRALPEQKRA